MGTCGQEENHARNILRISTLDISTECKPDIKWISTSHLLNFWRARNWILELSLLCAPMFYFSTVELRQFCSNWVLIKTLKSGSERYAATRQLYRECVWSVPGLSSLPSCSNHVYNCAGIGEQSTKFNRLFKFNHVYKTVCHLHTAHTLSRAFFVQQDFVALKHCISHIAEV